MKHHILAGLAAGAFLVSPLLSADKAPDPEDVLAKGRAIEVKRGELDEAVERHARELLNNGKMVTDEERPRVEAGILERLVFLKVMLARATDADKATGAEKARKAMEEVKSRAGTESAYLRLLQRAALDEPTFLKLKLEEQTTLAVLDRELRSKITVSDDAVARYYNENPDRFERPELIKVAHLLISTREAATGRELSEEQKKEKRKIADDLLARVKKGEDWATLVKQNTEDSVTRNNGGELTLARGQTVVEFEAIATALQPGQISDIVTTQYGYHIIKGIEHRPPGKMALADVSKDIREFLAQKEFEKQVPEFTERVKKEAGVELTPLAPKPALPAAEAK